MTQNVQDKLGEENEQTLEQTLEGVEDVYLVAYLFSLGFIAIPYMKEANGMEAHQSTRVVWDIQGQNIEQARREYYSNKSIGAKDFVRSLKEVKNDMYTIRGMDNTGNNLTNKALLTDSQSTRRIKKV